MTTAALDPRHAIVLMAYQHLARGAAPADAAGNVWGVTVFLDDMWPLIVEDINGGGGDPRRGPRPRRPHGGRVLLGRDRRVRGDPDRVRGRHPRMTTTTRRRRAAPGVRPPRGERWSHRTCVVCSTPFTLDRQAQPWSRARTCSTRCARVLGNRTRTAANCRHCGMVEEFRLAQDADIRRIDTACRDEDARPVEFREWLRHYPWTTEEEPAA